MEKPLLMLHSGEDIYSTPAYAQKLYELAGSRIKQLVWFEHGHHAMLRITDTRRYDTAIAAFIAQKDAAFTERENYNSGKEGNPYVL